MPWKIEKAVRENPALRESFMDLAIKTFHLDFHNWHQNGFWGDRYIPYVMTDGKTVAANVSVNVIDMLWDGTKRRYIQLGTVMTAPEYRGQGFSRRLMETVLSDWRDCSDGIYLFANDSVLDFYPKFGFCPMGEYQVSVNVTPKKGNICRLDMSDPRDLQRLFSYYKKGNPHSRFAMVDNEGLLAFYCTGFLKENVYYLPEAGAVAVAEPNGDGFLCYDVFSDGQTELKGILETLAGAINPQASKAMLGFAPKGSVGESAPLKEEDTTLFLLEGFVPLYKENRIMFPLLSRA